MPGFTNDLSEVLKKALEGAPMPSGEFLLREPEVLECSANRIYFYSEIDRSSILKLNSRLRDRHNDYLIEAQIHGMEKPKPIILHVNSYGGSIFHGMAGMDAILSTRRNLDVLTVVDGCCASAATFLTIVGSHRMINPNAFMLIHQLSSVMWGKFEEFKDEMQNLERLMKSIKTIYSRYTKIPSDILDEILKHDIWFNAEECLKFGLVDEIL